MSLDYRFGPETGYAEKKRRELADRWNDDEDWFFHNELPFMLLNVCVGAVTKSSAEVIVHRQLLRYFRAYVRTALFAAQQIRRGDPEDIRKSAIYFRRSQMNDPRRLFVHWLLTRYEGVSTNVGTDGDRKYMSFLHQRGDGSVPKTPPKFGDIVGREIDAFWREPKKDGTNR